MSRINDLLTQVQLELQAYENARDRQLHDVVVELQDYAGILRSLGYRVDFRGVYKDGVYQYQSNCKAAIENRKVLSVFNEKLLD